MSKWIACIAVVVAFLFAALPYLLAEEPQTRPAEGAASPIPKLTDEQVAQVQQWIKDLDSDQFATREAAEESLKRTGPGVLPFVQGLVAGGNVEVAERAGRIVDAMMDQLPAWLGKVKITIKLDKETYKVGEKMQLTLTIANRDQEAHEIPVVRGVPDPRQSAYSNLRSADYPWRSADSYELKGPEGKVIEAMTGAIVPVRTQRGLSRMPAARGPLVLKPGSSIAQTVAMTLLKDEPQGGSGPTVPQAAPKEGPVQQEGAGAVEKPQVETPAFLRLGSGLRYYPLPAAGKYTLQLRHLFRPDAEQPAADGGVEVKPPKGTLESNVVEFEVAP